MIEHINEYGVSIAMTVKVNGDFPIVEYPSIGDEMLNGAIITSSSQTDYSQSFSRAVGNCEIINLDATLITLEVNGDGTASIGLVMIRNVKASSDDEAYEQVEQAFLKNMGVSNIVILDDVTGVIYNATLDLIEEYDLQIA